MAAQGLMLDLEYGDSAPALILKGLSFSFKCRPAIPKPLPGLDVPPHDRLLDLGLTKENLLFHFGVACFNLDDLATSNHGDVL